MMRALPLLLVLLLCVLTILETVECRRPRRRRMTKQQKQQRSRDATTRPTTTPVTTTETIVAAEACHVICEGDSTILEDSCSCGCLQSGFGYDPDSGQCKDIDECADESTCQGGACVNTVGSYHCASCLSGYNLHANGKVCLPVPTLILPCRGLQCLGESSLDERRCRCKCNSGMNYDYFTENCADIDECAEGIDNCEYTCTNSIGTYRCACPPGFRLNPYDLASCDPVDPDCRDSSQICASIASPAECAYSAAIRNMCQKSCRLCVS